MKNIKFDFNRFSRYKLKKEAEEVLADASEDFLTIAMERLSVLAQERGSARIHLADIRRLMGECVEPHIKQDRVCSVSAICVMMWRKRAVWR